LDKMTNWSLYFLENYLEFSFMTRIILALLSHF
jgi:hypothetical protein